MSEYSTEKSMYESMKQEVENLEIQTKQAKKEMDMKSASLQNSFTATKESVLDSLETELKKCTENLKKYEIVYLDRRRSAGTSRGYGKYCRCRF